MNTCPPLAFSLSRRLVAILAYGLLLLTLSFFWLLLTTAPAAANSPPTFTSSPVLTVPLRGVYTYTITTGDPDVGDARTLSAPIKPAWLTFTDNANDSGHLTGIPGPDDVGDHLLLLKVSDAAGQTALQRFSVTVSIDPWPKGSIVGRITAAGVGVEGVKLTLECDDFGEYLCVATLGIGTKTDAVGNFRLDGLQVFNYYISFESPPEFSTPSPITVAVWTNEVTTVPEISIISPWSDQLFLPRVGQSPNVTPEP